MNPKHLIELILRSMESNEKDTLERISYFHVKMSYMLFKFEFKNLEEFQYREIDQKIYLQFYSSILISDPQIHSLMNSIFFKIIIGFFQLFVSQAAKKISSYNRLDSGGSQVFHSQNEFSENEAQTNELQKRIDTFWLQHFRKQMRKLLALFEQKDVASNKDEDEHTTHHRMSPDTRSSLANLFITEVFEYVKDRFSNLAIEYVIPDKIVLLNSKILKNIEKYSKKYRFHKNINSISRRVILYSFFQTLTTILFEFDSFSTLYYSITDENLRNEFNVIYTELTRPFNLDKEKIDFENINKHFFKEKALLQSIILYFVNTMNDIYSEDLQRDPNRLIGTKKSTLQPEKFGVSKSNQIITVKNRRNALSTNLDDQSIKEISALKLMNDVKDLAYKRLTDPRLAMNNDFMLIRKMLVFEFGSLSYNFRTRIFDLLELKQVFVDQMKQNDYKLAENDLMHEILTFFMSDDLQTYDISNYILDKKINIDVETKFFFETYKNANGKLYRCNKCKLILTKFFLSKKLKKRVQNLETKGWICTSKHNPDNQGDQKYSSEKYFCEKEALECNFIISDGQQPIPCREQIPKNYYELTSPFPRKSIHIMTQPTRSEFRFSDRMAEKYIEAISVLPPFSKEENRYRMLNSISNEQATKEKIKPHIVTKVKELMDDLGPMKGKNMTEQEFKEYSNSIFENTESQICFHLNKVLDHQTQISDAQFFVKELDNDISGVFGKLLNSTSDMRRSAINMLGSLHSNEVISVKTMLTQAQLNAVDPLQYKTKFEKFSGRKVSQMLLFNELKNRNAIHSFQFYNETELPNIGEEGFLVKVVYRKEDWKSIFKKCFSYTPIEICIDEFLIPIPMIENFRMLKGHQNRIRLGSYAVFNKDEFHNLLMEIVYLIYQTEQFQKIKPHLLKFFSQSKIFVLIY